MLGDKRAAREAPITLRTAQNEGDAKRQGNLHNKNDLMNANGHMVSDKLVRWGYILAILGGLGGFLIGVFITYRKLNYKNMNSFYSINSRKQGENILGLSIVVLASIAFVYWLFVLKNIE